MSRSFLAAVRDAMRPVADDLFPEGSEPGADASISEPPQPGASTEGIVMSNDQNTPGAATTSAPLAPAPAAAAPAATSNDVALRMTAILGANGIKGDGKRMAAALDLAVSAPDMAAEAVVSFISANVSAATPETAATEPTTSAADYEASRLAAADLAQPSGGPKKGRTGLAAAVTTRIENLKRSA